VNEKSAQNRRQSIFAIVTLLYSSIFILIARFESVVTLRISVSNNSEVSIGV